MRAGAAESVAAAGIGPAAPWRWLQQATALLRAHPRILTGATALLMAMALAPSVVQLALAGASPRLAQALALLLSLLLYPPAVGGYYRLVHALASGSQPAPSSRFNVFADARAVRRLVVANLIFVSGALLVVSLLAWTLGGESLLQFLQALSALQPGAKQLPPLPPGALPLVLALALLGAALVSAQGLAYAELALGERAPLAAIAAALRATGRNFGMLLLFYVPVAVLGFLLFMLVALAAVLLGSLLSVLSAALAPAIVLLCSLLLALAMYALLFTFFYFAWRELFDTPPPPPAPVHRIAA
jgi:hypothetical protein